MSVSRKLFVAMAAFIVGMGLVFAFVTQIALRDALEVMVAAPRKEKIDELSRLFAEHYEKTETPGNMCTPLMSKTNCGRKPVKGPASSFRRETDRSCFPREKPNRPPCSGSESEAWCG